MATRRGAIPCAILVAILFGQIDTRRGRGYTWGGSAAAAVRLTADCKRDELPQGTSILIESDHGIVGRCQDELPAVAR